MHPFACSAKNRLTIRSSSEWNEITASRPPGRSISSAAGSAASSWPSSSFTAIRSAWKTRFAGWPSPNRAGVGIASLITSTSSPVRVNGGLRPPTDDRARDGRGEPLLAVAAEDRDELPLVPGVDDRGGGRLRGRVHAHVERRVGRVGEAALGPVDLHRRDPEVEQDRVRLHVVCRELREDEREVAAQEPHVDPGARLEAVEVALRGRVAVDRDELAAPSRSSARRRAWPPAPNVASTTVSPGPHREELAHLVGEDRDVVSCPMRCKTFGSMLGAPFDGVQVLLPGTGVPELEVVVVARDDDLALEAGVAARTAGTRIRPERSRSASAAPEKKNRRSSRASRDRGSSAAMRGSTLTFHVSRG